MGYVSNEPLREAFLRDEVTACELGRRLGLTRRTSNRPSRIGDESAVRRALGLKPYRIRAGRHFTTQRYMRADTALRYCEALNLDPVDVGL